MIVYLDWNVFDRVEKRNSLVEQDRHLYTDLYNRIVKKEIICPYSNAHLNDLIRGYKNNSSYISAHLKIISELTNDLCICQYWKQSRPIWHQRSVEEFFYSAVEDGALVWESFDDLVDEKFDLDGIKLINPISMIRPVLKLTPVPDSFKNVFRLDPIFSIIYAKTKVEMTEWALYCDIYNFSILLKKDYALYKSFKKFLAQQSTQSRKNAHLIQKLNKSDFEIPKHLSIEEMFEQVTIENSTSISSAYDKFFDIFFKLDLKGYKSDGQFSNLSDDALHSYYAVNCDYFITNDDRCQYKAEKTFAKLNISTKVMNADLFSKSILRDS